MRKLFATTLLVFALTAPTHAGITHLPGYYCNDSTGECQPCDHTDCQVNPAFEGEAAPEGTTEPTLWDSFLAAFSIDGN